MFAKTFGVELEFIAPIGMTRSDIADRLNAAGVGTYDAGYSHAVSRKWKLVSDASVMGMGRGAGMEIVSPILSGENGLAELKIVCETLGALNCSVNKTCGLHVHVGARDMTVPAMRRLAILYSDFESVIDSLMPVSRRASNNQYLQSMRLSGNAKAAIASDRDVRSIASRFNHGSRYVKLNFTAHWKHGTVEFRHFAGTINYAKARNWILACLRMVVAAERDAGVPVMVSQAVTQRRPSQPILARLYDLCARPNGVTREEARIELGRRSPPAMTRLTEDAGVQLRRVGQRYFLAEQAVVNTVQPTTPNTNDEISLAGFCSKLEMAQEETEFWAARQNFFAAAEANTDDRIGFAPGSRAAARYGQ